MGALSWGEWEGTPALWDLMVTAGPSPDGCVGNSPSQAGARLFSPSLLPCQPGGAGLGPQGAASPGCA